MGPQGLVASFCFLFIVSFYYCDALRCTCDPTTTTNATANCTFAVDANNNTVNLTGCTCINATYTVILNVTLNYNNSAAYCMFIPTTTAPPTTTVCVDSNKDGICDYLEYAEELRCYNQTLSTSMSTNVWYGMIFATVWIIFWCLLCILINICHKNSGHHRYIHLYEELGIIILMVCIGVLNFAFDTYAQQNNCKIVGICSHFFMVLVAAAFFFEATFAESMVHGKPKKNGCCPAFLNYIFPIILAAIPAGLTYYFQKDNYGTTYLHCFAVLTQDMMWGFIIPVWILICVATLQAQLACLACDMTRKDQDQKQCYWAKKSAKSLVLVAYMILSIWLLIMHAGDEQLLYLFIIAIVLCVIFGPLIFVCHTFCHVNTCIKWGRPSGLKKMYMMCPEREVNIIEKEKIVYVDRPIPAEEKKPLADQPNNPYNPNKPYDPMQPAVGDTHTPAQQYYSWLYDKKRNAEAPQDILFRPKPQ